MIYILLDQTPKDSFSIKGDMFKYLIKVRRHNEGDEINFRCKDDMKTLYSYKISSIENRTAEATFIDSRVEEVEAKKNLHIGWCIIDTNSIERVLPSLSEIGVDRISFISCDRSQKNFKADFKRFERILEASMQQCGRSSYIKFDTFGSVEEFIAEFPDTKVFDFTEKTLDEVDDIETVLIGCEGGFSAKEREFLKAQDVFRLNTPMVLRSESAAMAVASKVIL